MAYLYRRGDSGFIWVCYRDAENRLRQESTRLRWDSVSEVRKAKAVEARLSAGEFERGANIIAGRPSRKGWHWVLSWLETRYAVNGTTLERYLDCWRMLLLFLDEHKVEGPTNLLRQHCFDYINWRQREDTANGKYKAGRNTALLELKLLRLIMQEAVIRGLVTGNPCLKLGIEKEKVTEKPELTAADEKAIREGFKRIQSPAIRTMLQASFEIARYQGCRLSETRLDPFADVDLERMQIRFKAKGGRQHVTALHPALVPLFERLRREGKRATWEIPTGQGRQWASAKWWKFLDRIGLKGKGITHHCNRVTVITEMIRKGVPEALSQRYVGHSSTTVHRLYQRLNSGDLSACVAAVGKPRSSSTPSALGPTSKRKRRPRRKA